MGRLIPFTLQPSRLGVEYSSPPSPPPNYPLPEIPSRRRTTEMLPVNSPRSQKDWHQVLDEVRSLYLKRQYKQCSARCVRLLEEVEGIKIPLYRIYVSFYAATCLELTGRNLPMSSSQKLQLFELARLHYQNAQNYMWQACKEHTPPSEHLESQLGKLRDGSTFALDQALDQAGAGSRSSVCSVTDSAVSLTFSTPVHSPASSVSSFSSKGESPETTQQKPFRVKKTVSFESGTEAYASSSDEDINGNTTSTKKYLSQIEISSDPTREKSSATLNHNPTTADNVSYFLSSRSVPYQAHLTSLGARLTHHMYILDVLISEIQAQRPYARHMRSNTAGSSSDISTSSKRGGKHIVFDDFTNSFALAQSVEPKEQERKMRARAERIKELKRRGEEWKSGRGRFDGKRYEVLCDEVMRELNA